jgi:hypothetical protein
MPVSGASPTRGRRSKAEMETLRESIFELLAAEAPMTVRQVFYRLVGAGLVAKTESEYSSTVCRLLSQMRLDDELPFSWIADNTRWMRKPRTYDGIRDILDITASAYRRDLWSRQPEYVEVWLEKEALAGVLMPVTEEFDVPLMVTRGYPSLSFLHSAAESIPTEKTAHIYYLGDLDPSGVDIARNVEQRLREFSDADIEFERVAVTPQQVRELSLPTRPTKATDPRRRRFRGESVEVDAIPPTQLRQLVRDCIEQHIDHDRLAYVKNIEAEERGLLERIYEIADDEGLLGEDHEDAE